MSTSDSKKKCIVVVVGYRASRCGLDADLEAIEETFSRLFDAEIIRCIEETKDEIKKKFREFTNEEWQQKFKTVNFVTVFCLAHGTTEGQILCKDSIGDVKRLLLHPLFKIEQLDRKLKWLVVQSCRGKLNDYVEPKQRDGKKTVFPDYHFISYCTGEGTISYQEANNEVGKIYIQALCRELQENVQNQSLRRMLINVNEAVKLYAVENKYCPFQKPEFIENCADYRFYDICDN